MPRAAAMITLWLVTLASLSAAGEKAASSFPVPLNHFYLALDSETYAAIESSDFLQKEFAVFERRTTVRTDKTYTGIYFYGIHTYFEFFDASKQTEFQQDRSGIAFAVERPGALKNFQARLAASAPELITRQDKGLQIPWFYMLDLEKFFPDSVLDSWVMEYHPEFLARWRPEAGGTRKSILREQILRRYKEVLPDAPRHPLFEDVIGLTVAADGPSITKMRQLCEIFGYVASMDSEATVLQGPDFVLRLIPETASMRGIKEATFRARRPPAGPAEFSFGPRSVLRFRTDGKAVWDF